MNREQPFGLSELIEKKRAVEKERPELTAEPRLITIDGVDGAGKSGLAKHLEAKLKAIYGLDQVLLVEATNLQGSPQQDQLKIRAKSKELSSKYWDKVYASGVNRAYNDLVIPALEAGKIVIIDRSEVDLLRFALLHGNEDSIEDRKKYIADGTLTHRYWPGNRISLQADPEDIWENLERRQKRSEYDPTSLADVKKFIRAEEEAEKIITSLKHSGQVNFINVDNPRVDDGQLDEHLDDLSEEIIQNLKIE